KAGLTSPLSRLDRPLRRYQNPASAFPFVLGSRPRPAAYCRSLEEGWR
ncbi:hypothetical protein HALTITAN_3313, partial [Vreelandella titanicae BH1]